VDPRPARVAAFSSSGDPTPRVLKPDLVARGTGVTAAVPDGWDVVSGTSIAAAHVSGQAAVLLGRRGATPDGVRSALLTTAHPLADTGLSAGAGEAVLHPTPALVATVPVRHYRQWLTGDRATVNQPHLLLSNGVHRGRRTITNVGRRPVSVSATVEGFRGDVTVSPATATLAPGASLRFTVRAAGLSRRTDDGAVVWRTGGGHATRVAVVVTR
jgi:subtilisin family serine protease